MGGIAVGQLVAVQKASIPYLTGGPGAAGHINNLTAKAYLFSIDSYLQNKGGNTATAWKARLSTIRSKPEIKQIIDNAADPVRRNNPVPGGARPFLLSLDKLAYEIKNDAGDPRHVDAVTSNVGRTLSTTNANTRAHFGTLIAAFDEFYQGDGAAATQTIVPKSGSTTFRIDRESLSALPAPRYWTYRIQAGGATHGGIEMESNIYFRPADVRTALTTSLNSTLEGHGPPRYIRLSAPQWLRDILNAA